jgi:hypothetical protein
MDEVMKDISNNFKENIFKKIYADDLVVVVKEAHLEQYISAAKDSFSRFGLIFNNKKSQILQLRKKCAPSKTGPKKPSKSHSLELVREYNYLGIRIDFKASMKPHLLFLRSRCAYLENSIRFYAQKLCFKNRYLLWVVYIRPYFVYCCNLL